MHYLSSLLLGGLTAVSAAPLVERQAPFQVTAQAPWNAGAVNEWQIAPSCNGSQRLQIQQGLAEAQQLAQHGKEHILRWGNSSNIYRKYFGNLPTPEAIGSLDILVNGDKARALFRCDNPDGNCDLEGYAGHWRGNNATDETVICPLSFEIRRSLSQVCSLGYNVREGSRTSFWAGDLMHRLYHVPAFGQGHIEHFFENYDEIIGNASLGNANMTHDSNGLTYFALEAYAYDVVLPGVGCPGPSGEVSESSSSSSATSSAATSTAASPTSTSASAESAAASATESALPENCHTHSNGDVHCSSD